MSQGSGGGPTATCRAQPTPRASAHPRWSGRRARRPCTTSYGRCGASASSAERDELGRERQRDGHVGVGDPDRNVDTGGAGKVEAVDADDREIGLAVECHLLAAQPLVEEARVRQVNGRSSFTNGPAAGACIQCAGTTGRQPRRGRRLAGARPVSAGGRGAGPLRRPAPQDVHARSAFLPGAWVVEPRGRIQELPVDLAQPPPEDAHGSTGAGEWH